MKKLFLTLSLFMLNHLIYSQCPNGFELSENLVENGNFSKGNYGFASEYQTNVNMVLEGAYMVDANARKVFGDFAGNGRNGEKDQFLIVNGSTIPNRILWGQRIEVLPNTDYKFEMWISNLVNSNPSRLRVYINGEAFRSSVEPHTEVGKWKKYTSKWNSGNLNHIYLEIICISTRKMGNDFGLDDISFRACLPIGKKHLAQRGTVTASLCGKEYALGQELLVNNSFENGNFGFSSAYNWRYQLKESGTYQVANFTESLNKIFKGRGHTNAYDRFLVANGSTQENTVVWSQQIPVESNQTHTFSGWVTQLSDYPPAVLQAKVNGKLIGKIKVEGKQYQWIPFNFQWKSTNEKSIQLSIYSISNEELGNDFGIDDLSFRACVPRKRPPIITQVKKEIIPEPARLPQIEKNNDVLPEVIEEKKFEEAINAHETLVLNNVQFEQGKYVLLSQGKEELNQLALAMEQIKQTKIILIGHTDNQGDATKNLRLSQRRVTVCKNYLIDKGIDENRIETKAFGQTKPVATNETEEGRKKNRRVEVEFVN